MVRISESLVAFHPKLQRRPSNEPLKFRFSCLWITVDCAIVSLPSIVYDSGSEPNHPYAWASNCCSLIGVIAIQGTIQRGRGDFGRRFTDHPEVFRAATGEYLHRGTVNVRIAEPLQIREHFRIDDPLDPNQVLQFEVCRANGKWAYRIRPLNVVTGCGGWGDDVIEIASSEEIPDAIDGATVRIEFFR
jgi:hypothetical protein